MRVLGRQHQRKKRAIDEGAEILAASENLSPAHKSHKAACQSANLEDETDAFLVPLNRVL